MDAEYRNAKGNSNTMGGLSGVARLELPTELPLAWWKLLVLGQYTGMGQRTTFGWGRYQLQTADQLLSYRRCLPAASLLQWCRDKDNLSKAWRHVMSNTDFILDPAETWLEEDQLETQPPEAPIERLSADMDRILSGEYNPPPLRGYLIPKKNGGVRPLAVPPVYDRVLQRSITQILSPALEKLMYPGSHGFRPGRSRITARYQIQAAWREGYRWVYESDIKDFFDSVRLDLLEDRLQALYGEDPMVPAILNWMRADVIFQGEQLSRRNGLPQGSPLSPLMANLMLDDFDSDMEALGFKLIRFADDFIILCKAPEQARAAGEAARASLEEHGLSLHPDKTRITPMKDGFKYLGYLFVNDMALDISGANTEPAREPLQPPPHSWLALLGEKQPQQLKQKQALEQLATRILKGKPFHIGEREANKTLLVISGEPSTISTLNRHVRAYRKDKRIADMPWRDLQAILLLGNHQITTQAMHAALQHQVNIHMANGYGRYQGVITQSRGSQGHRLWLRQLVCFEDPEKSLYCAREIVGARLRHMKETLRQRKAAADLPQLNHGIRNIHKAPDLESLRGLEGRATREYYARIAALLPPELQFSGRNRRPPRDPFNVLLSLGHTVVYGYSQSILHTVGLLPWQGFFHQGKGRHAALASDLMEPFRHLVERAALTLCLRQEISPGDFTWPDSGGCLINDDARRKFLARLLMRWEVTVRARGDEQPHSYFTHMHQQALSLKGFVANGEVFQPFRLR
jgi:group II intron reverse transcriptase/maturase/CRISPR-associated endonuclease Cas1